MAWIFVYGTLRSRGAAAQLLEDGVVDRQGAVLAGHALYGKSLPYPFMTAEPGRSVVGELVRLADDRAATMLERLDDYEGGEYRRTVVTVRAGGSAIEAFAWVAIDPGALAEDERIDSGDWFAPGV